MKYQPIHSHRFKKSLKKIDRSGRFPVDKYNFIIKALVAGEELPYTCHDHGLTGNWSGYRECHIESDILLIYQKDEAAFILTLVDIGSHPYLFGM